MKEGWKKKPSLQNTIKEMAENTSVHGIPKIVSSKKIHMKILWTLIVLGMFGYLGYNLQELFSTFYSYPVKTSVSLEFGTLRFPSVSFCNVNPIKKSMLNEASEAVRKVLKVTRTKRAAAGSPDNTGSASTNEKSTDSDPSGNAKTDSSATKKTTESTIKDKLTKSPITESKYWNDSDSSWDFYGTAVDGTNSLPSSKELKGELENLLATDDPAGTKFASTFIDNIAETMSIPKDKWFERVEEFQSVFGNESFGSRMKLGHSIEDMIVACSFDGRTCYNEEFKQFQSSEYGNCYTLDNGNLTTRRSGPMHGLWLTLNLEIPEYIESYSSAYGIKLVIHQPGTYPFPSEEGLVISSGHETMIGLRMIEVNRIKTPNKDCESGEEFESKFGINYTVPACIKLCKQQIIMKTCKCVPYGIDLDIANEMEENKLEMCDPHDVKDSVCQMIVDAQYNDRRIDCKCNAPCIESVFQKTLSARTWPNEEYLKNALIRNMCDNPNLNYISDMCGQFRNNKQDFPVEYLKDNFIRVIVFYEDLNYERIKEELMYDSFRFISDIGGTLGLFVGASLLSFVEILQLLMVLCTYFHARIYNSKEVAHTETKDEKQHDGFYPTTKLAFVENVDYKDPAHPPHCVIDRANEKHSYN